MSSPAAFRALPPRLEGFVLANVRTYALVAKLLFGLVLFLWATFSVLMVWSHPSNERTRERLGITDDHSTSERESPYLAPIAAFLLGVVPLGAGLGAVVAYSRWAERNPHRTRMGRVLAGPPEQVTRVALRRMMVNGAFASFLVEITTRGGAAVEIGVGRGEAEARDVAREVHRLFPHAEWHSS